MTGTFSSIQNIQEVAVDLVSQCNELGFDPKKTERILRRRGFGTGTWKRVESISTPSRPSLLMRLKVYWDGFYLGLVNKIGTDLSFQCYDNEATQP